MKIKNYEKSPNIDFEEKVLADNTLDYQEYRERKNLILKYGFKRKNFYGIYSLLVIIKIIR